MLVVVAARHGDAWQIVSCTIYGATLVMLFASSTLYHGCRGERAKHICRIIDHSSIYLLIAGTYTPFLLVNLRGRWGWSLFGVIWGLALAGIVFQVFFVHRFRLAQTLIYLAMGWLVVIAFKPLLAQGAQAGAAVAAAGRLVLHGGGDLLPMEKTSLPPCRLAPVRFGGKHLPLFRDICSMFCLSKEDRADQ